MKLSERTYQAIIAVLVLIILILGWQVFSGGTVKLPSTATTTSESTGGSSMSGSNESGSMSGSSSSSGRVPVVAGGEESVSIANQAAGMEVAVASVTLSQPGWIAVRDSNGRTLGAAWFDTGTHTAVSVPLLRETTSGGSYQALLYVDNGDHQFDLSADTLITNSDGSVPGTTFSAQ